MRIEDSTYNNVQYNNNANRERVNYNVSASTILYYDDDDPKTLSRDGNGNAHSIILI